MADIYRAYRLLNKLYDLDLKYEQIATAERMMKIALAEEKGKQLTIANVDDWEFFGTLKPRRTKDGLHKEFDVAKLKELVPARKKKRVPAKKRRD